jgi:hypothetical protein
MLPAVAGIAAAHWPVAGVAEGQQTGQMVPQD